MFSADPGPFNKRELSGKRCGTEANSHLLNRSNNVVIISSLVSWSQTGTGRWCISATPRHILWFSDCNYLQFWAMIDVPPNRLEERMWWRDGIDVCYTFRSAWPDDYQALAPHIEHLFEIIARRRSAGIICFHTDFAFFFWSLLKRRREALNRPHCSFAQTHNRHLFSSIFGYSKWNKMSHWKRFVTTRVFKINNNNDSVRTNKLSTTAHMHMHTINCLSFRGWRAVVNERHLFGYLDTNCSRLSLVEYRPS